MTDSPLGHGCPAVGLGWQVPFVPETMQFMPTAQSDLPVQESPAPFRVAH